MGRFNNSILRSVLAIILGLVLVLWPEVAINYLVITIGILFIPPGIFAILSYFTRDKEVENYRTFPLEAAGSILFGALLVIIPNFFVNTLMYLLGILLLIAGIQQLVSLIKARKWTFVGWGFYIIPVLLILVGIVILSKPFSIVSSTFIVFGVACLIYGVSELINAIRFRKRNTFTEVTDVTDTTDVTEI